MPQTPIEPSPGSDGKGDCPKPTPYSQRWLQGHGHQPESTNCLGDELLAMDCVAAARGPTVFIEYGAPAHADQSIQTSRVQNILRPWPKWDNAHSLAHGFVEH